MALPRLRATNSVSTANTPASTARPTLTHGPQVANARSRPGLRPCGALSVNGIARVDGGSMPNALKVLRNDESASIGDRSSCHRPDGSVPCTALVNSQRCASRFAWANWPGNDELPV